MQLVDDRLNKAYFVGVEKFLNYAIQRTGEMNEIGYPCVKCCSTTLGTLEIVRTYFKVYGITTNYTFWYHHGEV